jgi:general secretion pathway protein H
MAADAGERAPGRTSPRAHRRRPQWSSRVGSGHLRAFTLLEILLALALIGLLASALISGAVRLVSSSPQSPQEVFWDAAYTARRTALNAEREVRLSFDAKEKSFVLDDAGAKRTFPVPKAPRELTIDFLHAQATGGSVLIGGQLVDTATLEDVTFYGDGTCTPFRVQFRTNGPANVIAIDPWTCAPVLTEDDSR